MAFSPQNILAGPARIFVGTTAPASGTPPTLVGHTNGVPATGTEVGYTTGPVEFVYKNTKEEIKPEQAYMPVALYVTDEMAEITFECLEKTYNTLLRAFDNVGTVTDVNKDLFYFGNGTSIIAPFTATVFFSSPQRTNPAKYSIGMLYYAYNPEGVRLPFTKTKPMSYKMTFRALADVTRTAGDQGGQFFIEK